MDNNNKNNSPTDTNALMEENRLLSVRLNILQAFSSMWLTAYDALLSHGINVRTLKSYKDEALLDVGLKHPEGVEAGRNAVIEWVKRVENDIIAAIRRKQLKKV